MKMISPFFTSMAFSDDDIWDIGAITGLFALSNRMASLTSMRPNAEFYALGRDFPIAGS
jgi:hypothetical protein